MDTPMEHRPLRLVHPAPPLEKRQVVDSSLLGMMMFIFAELMMFAGFISAHAIARASLPADMWPPPGQPSFPVSMTAANTVVLLLSGFFMYRAYQTWPQGLAAVRRPYSIALVLGAAFVGVQGVEWAQLIAQGLTLQSSVAGGFFYVVVGAHALHAVAALVAMGLQFRKLLAGTLQRSGFLAMMAFWFFVVGVWPVIFWQVYL